MSVSEGEQMKLGRDDMNKNHFILLKGHYCDYYLNRTGQ